MAESKEASQTSDLPSSSSISSFLEVSCKTSGIVRRFAPGTRADFALSLINSKLDVGAPLALYIEAAKVGEESIYFGPTAVLLAYGNGWNLQTVLDSNQGMKKSGGTKLTAKNKVEDTQALNSNTRPKREETEPALDFMYIAKIAVAFVFIFLLAGIFTLALENLPKLMVFFNSSF